MEDFKYQIQQVQNDMTQFSTSKFLNHKMFYEFESFTNITDTNSDSCSLKKYSLNELMEIDQLDNKIFQIDKEENKYLQIKIQNFQLSNKEVMMI